MSVPASTLRMLSAQEWMGALVRVGLAEFGTEALPEPSPVFAALAEEAYQTLGPEHMAPWMELRARTEEAWPLADGQFGRLNQDFGLNMPQAFLLALVGEVEASHLVSVALAELQAPAAAYRPTVHFCIAIVEALFRPGALTAHDFHDMTLIQRHVLQLEGDGPVPLRTLRVNPSLWAVLCGRPVRWPECSRVQRTGEAVLPGSLLRQVPTIATLLHGGETEGLVLRGTPGSGRAELTAALAEVMGLQALEVPLPVWEHEQTLPVACRYAGWLPMLRLNLGPGEVRRLPMGTGVPMVILLGIDGAVETGRMMELELPLPAEGERRAVWTRHLGDAELAAEITPAALLSGPNIVKVATNARLLAERAEERITIHHVAEARRQLGVEGLRLLAQPVDRRVTAEALVLSPFVAQELENMIVRARRRESLWHGLGVTLQATRNAGVRALLVGESGTGKTLAACYVATALGAPLYRVDLAAVMNKYVGESEKNLAALLDQAAANDVVLLFDEADSVFGRRTEGKETGERYANMLTNFLLTRIENHPGIVILTTNSRDRIDNAFTRRLDVIAEFPLPGYEERLQLWQSHLGERGPGEHTYKYFASYCDLGGGQIRNVVLAAAACANRRKIETADLLRGLENEYRKLGRAMPAKLGQLRTGADEA